MRQLEKATREKTKGNYLHLLIKLKLSLRQKSAIVLLEFNYDSHSKLSKSFDIKVSQTIFSIRLLKYLI